MEFSFLLSHTPQRHQQREWRHDKHNDGLKGGSEQHPEDDVRVPDFIMLKFFVGGREILRTRSCRHGTATTSMGWKNPETPSTLQ
jgi:hypothetical protein